MEYKHKGVTFFIRQGLIGLEITVTKAPTSIDFSREDIQAVVKYLSANIPTEVSYAEERPWYRANFTLITEAMVTNALKAVG